MDGGGFGIVAGAGGNTIGEPPGCGDWLPGNTIGFNCDDGCDGGNGTTADVGGPGADPYGDLACIWQKNRPPGDDEPSFRAFYVSN